MRASGISIIILAVLVLLAVRSVGGYIQTQDYRMALRRVRKLGKVGIGQKDGSLLGGSTAIIACDSRGIITGAEVRDGIGVFSRFHQADKFLSRKLVGNSIFDLLDMTEGFSSEQFEKWQEYIRALEALEVRLTDRELTREQEKFMDRQYGRDRKRV